MKMKPMFPTTLGKSWRSKDKQHTHWKKQLKKRWNHGRGGGGYKKPSSEEIIKVTLATHISFLINCLHTTLGFSQKRTRRRTKTVNIMPDRRINKITPGKTHQLEGVARVVPHVGGDNLTDHGVLPHQDSCLAAKGETDVGHLVRSHIVSLRAVAEGRSRGR